MYFVKTERIYIVGGFILLTIKMAIKAKVNKNFHYP